jgi:hypothetical protein
VTVKNGQPPKPRPAWRWLWVAVLGAIAALVGAEAAVLPDALRSGLEFGAAIAAIVAALLWVRANREALARADLQRADLHG